MIKYSLEEWDETWKTIDKMVERSGMHAGEALQLFNKYFKDKVFYDVATETYNIKESFIKESFIKLIKNPTVLLN